MIDNANFKETESKTIAEPVQLNELQDYLESESTGEPIEDDYVRRSDSLIVHEDDGCGATVKLDEYAFVGREK